MPFGSRRGAQLFAGLVCVVLVVIVRFAGTVLVVDRRIEGPSVIASLASHEWDRLPETAALAAQFPNALVVLTLPETVTPFNCHDCSRRVDRLNRAGVPTARIVILPLREAGTRGEALAVRRMMTERGFQTLLVVTSPYHTRRSLSVFRHLLDPSVQVGVVPARSVIHPAQPDLWWAYPVDRAYVLYEWAGLVYYRLRYGVPIIWRVQQREALPATRPGS